ncbi:MAG: hypothetical protein WAO93_00800 [Orrella sp.]
MLEAQPMAVVVLIGGCDKTVLPKLRGNGCPLTELGSIAKGYSVVMLRDMNRRVAI